MVREEGGTWAQTAMTVPDPGSEPQAPTLLPDPFSERAPRPKGAYLHWALPDALTGGSGTAHGGDVSFPPIPDRWLVVRLSTPQPGARRAVTAWVLESGGAAAGGDAARLLDRAGGPGADDNARASSR